MTSILFKLLSYGAQDYYLTGNSNINFFKVQYKTYYKLKYKRHTNFSIEPAQSQEIILPLNFWFNKKCSLALPCFYINY